MVYLLIMIIYLESCESCECANVLVMWMSNLSSHWRTVDPLCQKLVHRGHHLTVVSSFPQKHHMANYTDVDLSFKRPPIEASITFDHKKNKLGKNPLKQTARLFDLGRKACAMLDEPEFKDLLKAEDKYDLILTQIFGSDCFAYFAHKLNVPLISITTSVNVLSASERTGQPDNPSYIPNYHVGFSSDMSLWQRLVNTLTLLNAKFWNLWIFAKETQASTQVSFGQQLPPVGDVVANTSLLFVNSHYVLHQSRPFPPNVIEIGGIHIGERSPLPEVGEKYVIEEN